MGAEPFPHAENRLAFAAWFFSYLEEPKEALSLGVLPVKVLIAPPFLVLYE